MSLRLSHTTWDALDPHAIAEFWRALLGWEGMKDAVAKALAAKA